VDNKNTIPPPLHAPVEGLDVNKLKIILRSNWYWLVLIFIAVNAAAYLYIRYTKNLYQSDSEIKLELSTEASEFGIKSVVEDQNLNLISGEMELIQSRLFLNQVLDSTDIELSYFSVGRVLNDELFRDAPFEVTYTIKPNGPYNVPLYFDETSGNGITIRIGEHGTEVAGQYGENIHLDGLDMRITRNDKFKRGDEVGYFFVINNRDALLNYLRQNLTVEPINFNANTIRISFRDHNPAKAQFVLNEIDSAYLQYSYQQKNLANKQKIDWLAKELGQIEKKMEAYEDYFENFTLQNRTNNLDEDLRATVELITRLDSQRFVIAQRITRLDEIAANLNNTEADPALIQRQSLPDYLVTALEEYQKLALEQEKLRMSYSEKTFAYRQRQVELESIRTKTAGQINAIRKDLVQRLAELNNRKKHLENEFANLPDKNTQFSKNLRFYKLNEQFYLTLIQSKSEFEIAQAGSIPDFKILSPASYPYTPLSPRKSMITGAGLVASLGMIVFLIGILYLLNNRITGLYDIERLRQLPILGVVPASRYSSAGGIYVAEHPRSMVSEAIRTLRTNLEFFNIQSDKKIVAVSSTVSGEGKSFIAMNLGGVIALSRKRVVLLDLDMRKPKHDLPAPFNETSRGISTILIRKNTWEECVVKTQLETFDYIPSGPHPPNPSELLLNGDFDELLAELKKHYDYIILDTPPVGLVTDGIMAMKRADIAIYVFRVNYSRKDFITNLQRIVNINKFSNITTLLNALPSTGENRYGYGYYEEASSTERFKKFFKG